VFVHFVSLAVFILPRKLHVCGKCGCLISHLHPHVFFPFAATSDCSLQFALHLALRVYIFFDFHFFAFSYFQWRSLHFPIVPSHERQTELKFHRNVNFSPYVFFQASSRGENKFIQQGKRGHFCILIIFICNQGDQFLDFLYVQKQPKLLIFSGQNVTSFEVVIEFPSGRRLLAATHVY
jgi:hypothetical protein